MKFYPYEKGGTTSFKVVLTRKLEVLPILGGGGGGGATSFHPLKGGGARSFGPVISPFCTVLSPRTHPPDPPT